MPDVRSLRWARGMLSVAGVEHRSPALASAVLPAELRVAGAKTWQRNADMSLLPAAVRPDRDAFRRRIGVPVKADLVAFATRDVDNCPKLRSFYTRRRLSARIQADLADRPYGISRVLKAYRQVRQHVPELIPEVFDYGPVPLSRDGRYLVEELVIGSNPVGPDEIQELIEPLAALLKRLYLGVGVTSHPLSAIVHSELPMRWRALVRDICVDHALDAAVRRLVERDDLVEVSLAHGDLVASNILTVGDRIVLVDWEYVGERPIAFELAKIHLASRDPDIAQNALERGLGRSVGHRPGHYSFAEQLALAHVQMLSWHRIRVARAVQAGRSTRFAAQYRQRLQAIAYLLDVDTAAAGGPRPL